MSEQPAVPAWHQARQSLYLELSLGDLLEGIVLHAFEAKPPFQPETVAKIEPLKEVYGCGLTADHCHRMTEAS